MRRIVTAAVIASAILITGCNTVRGVGRDVRSFKEVVPGGSSHASADQPAATPAAAPTETPTATQ
jgi:predicted small secreted protein